MKQIYTLIDDGDAVVDFNHWQREIVLGERMTHSYFNTGGRSTGAAFVLVSDFFAEFQGTFSLITLEKSTDLTDKNWVNGNCETHTAQFEKITMPDGRTGMIARFPDFVFPQGIILPTPRKYSKATEEMRHARGMLVRYTINSDCDVPPNTMVEVALIPRTESMQVKSLNMTLQTPQQHRELMRERFAQLGI